MPCYGVLVNTRFNALAKNVDVMRLPNRALDADSATEVLALVFCVL